MFFRVKGTASRKYLQIAESFREGSKVRQRVIATLGRFDRAAILESLGNALKSGDKSLVGNKGFRRFLKAQKGSRFAIDKTLVATDERYDGLFVLRTDTDHPSG
jgi:hypothetical protein